MGEIPLAPLRATLLGATSGAINAANAGRVVIALDFGTPLAAGDAAALTLVDSSGATHTLVVRGPERAGRFAFPPQDLSALPDGPIDVFIAMAAANGTRAPAVPIATWLKDTVPPSLSVEVDVALDTNAPAGAGASPRAGIINRANVAASSLILTVVGPIEADLRAELSLALGTAVRRQSFALPPSGAALALSRWDLRALPDGPIAVSLAASDAAGNVTHLSLAPLRKDTYVARPLAVRIPPAGSTPSETIAAANAGAVVPTVEVDPTALQAGDRVSIELRAPGASLTTDAEPLSALTSRHTLRPFDARTLNDGRWQMFARIEDDAGNFEALAGPEVRKDTLIPSLGAPSAIDAAGSPTGSINALSAGAARIAVALQERSAGDERLSLRIADGNTTLESAQSIDTGAARSIVWPLDLRALQDGQLVLEAVITDSAGNRSVAPIGSLEKDTAPPATPLRVGIAAGPGHPADTLNSVNAASATYSIEFGPGTSASDRFELRIPSASLRFGPYAALASPGEFRASGIDLSALAEGTFELEFIQSDAVGNERVLRRTMLKDTIAPPNALELGLPAGALHPAEVVNAANASQAVPRIAFALVPARAEIAISDGRTERRSGPIAMPTTGGVVLVPAMDLRAQDDGPLTMRLEQEDAAGNRSTQIVALHKDTRIPNARGLAVGATAEAPSATINAHTARAVALELTVDPATAPEDRLILEVQDALGQRITRTVDPIGANGLRRFDGIDLSLLADGPIALRAILEDSAGHRTAIQGASATKDVLPPAPADAVRLLSAGPGSPGTSRLPLALAAQIQVEVDLSANSVAGERIDLELTDGTESLRASFLAAGGLETRAVLLGDAGHLRDGPLTLSATVQDAAANASTPIGVAIDKDTVAPRAPTLIHVPAAGPRPQNAINAASASAVIAAIAFDSDADPSATAILTVSDGLASVATAAFAPAPGASIALPPMDLQGLVDGVLSVTLELRDPAGNLTLQAGPALVKDVVVPSALTASVAAVPGRNASGIINRASEGEVIIAFDLAASVAPNDRLTLQLLDASSAARTRTLPAGLPLQRQEGGLSAIGLLDGPIALELRLEDDAGNQSALQIAGIVKDVVPPDAAESASLPAGSSWPVDVINASNANQVALQVVLGQSSEINTRADILLQAGAQSLTRSATASGGAEVLSFSGIDATAIQDGPVALEVTLQDLAGNVARTSVALFKDTVAPELPVQVSVPAEFPRPADTLNALSASAFVAFVQWSATADASATATYTLEDGSTSIRSATSAIQPGTVQAWPVLDASALADGLVALQVAVQDAAGNRALGPLVQLQKDTVLPPPAASVRLPAQGTAPAMVVNASTAANTLFEIELGANVDPLGSVHLEIQSGATTVTSASTVPVPQAVLQITGQDLSGLPEGPASLYAITRDLAGNTSITTGGTVLVDRVAPGLPTSFGLAAGPNNPQDFVNALSVASARIELAFGADADPSATGDLRLRQGGALIAVPLPSPLASTTVQTTTVDLSSFADGAISVELELRDAAGNSAAANGRAGAKDVLPPVAATGLSLPAQFFSPPGVIASFFDEAVRFDATFAAQAIGDETATIELSDGQNIARASFSVPAGGGTRSFTGVDARALQDGQISTQVIVRDPAGNPAVFQGPTVLKDTVPADLPLAVVIEDSGNLVNPPDVINIASASNVKVRMDVGPSSQPFHFVQVDLTAVGANLRTNVQLTTGGAQSFSFTGLDLSGFPDGPVILTGFILEPNGNVTVLQRSVIKDTVLPELPTSVQIRASGERPANVINIANQAAVVVEATWPSGTFDPVFAQVGLSDTGFNPFTSNFLLVSPASSVAFDALDMSAAHDGPVQVQLLLLDQAFNFRTFVGPAVVKDTLPPPTPAGASIPGGPAHPANTINQSNQHAVYAYGASGGSAFAPNDALRVRLMGAGAEIITNRIAPIPTGLSIFQAFDARSLSDGPLSIAAEAIDAAGNVSVSPAILVTKATAAPLAPIVDPVRPETPFAAIALTGRADPGSMVIASDGSHEEQVSADADGLFVLSFPLAPQTTRTLVVQTEDGLRNRSAAVSEDFRGRSLTVRQSAAAAEVPFVERPAGFGAPPSGEPSASALADFDGDGDLDLYVGAWNRLWLQEAGVGFVDATQIAGIALEGGRSALAVDVDSDGDVDLLTVDDLGRLRYWRNEVIPSSRLTFTEITVASGLGGTTDLYGLCAFDLEPDGDLDLFAVSGQGGAGSLWRQDGGPFVAVSGTGFDLPLTNPRWLAAGDLDGDRRFDFAINDVSPGRLLLSGGPGGIYDAAGPTSGYVSAAALGPGAVIADFDGDGDLDLVQPAGPELFLHDGHGQFRSVAGAALLTGPLAARDGLAGDFDHDGRIDLYLLAPGVRALFLNRGDQAPIDFVPEFQDVAAHPGGGLAAPGTDRLALGGDLDRDGDLDLLLLDAGSAPRWLENRLDDARSLQVRLIGKGPHLGGSNPSAIGAAVRVRDQITGAFLGLRTVAPARGRGQSDPTWLHFGGLTPSRPLVLEVDFPGQPTLILTGVRPADLPHLTLTVVQP